MPKHDSVNATMAKIRPMLGVCLITGRGRPAGCCGQFSLSGGRLSSWVGTPSCGFAITICSSEL